jgi:hypothetical protein
MKEFAGKLRRSLAWDEGAEVAQYLKPRVNTG